MICLPCRRKPGAEATRNGATCQQNCGTLEIMSLGVRWLLVSWVPTTAVTFASADTQGAGLFSFTPTESAWLVHGHCEPPAGCTEFVHANMHV